jgi:hypothetical protein
MTLCLLGETEEAVEIAEFITGLLESVPQYAVYLVPHTLYWCARAYMTEMAYSKALVVIKRALKYKTYEFPIQLKLNRLLKDTQSKCR